jgi:ATP-dependent Zn protease
LHDPSIIALIKKRLDRCHSIARDLVAKNHVTLEAVARRLEKTGYLDRTAIDELLKNYPVSIDGHPTSSRHATEFVQ